ncbi:MAG: LTA synthase family protein [Firmicutes bacterium]|nr:LTA synthase family protein [Bacillota bacterium]
MRKSASLWFYFLISILFMETVFRLATGGSLLSQGSAVSAVFSIFFATACFLLVTIFGRRMAIIISAILLGVAGFIFSSQMMYYVIFRTYYTVYSALHSTQAFEFWQDTLAVVFSNWFWLLFYFAPFLVFIFFGRKLVQFPRLTWPTRALVAICLLLTHGAGILMIHAGGQARFSAHDLYYRTNYHGLAVDRLGLLTTMRLDVQRYVGNWTPATPAAAMQPTPDNLHLVPATRNQLDIDFAALIADEEDETLRNMHKYFSRVPATAKNEFTGIYEGYNLIYITAESFSHLAIDPELTPTLYKMMHEGYNFRNFYTPIWGVSTSDGEYVACTGLLPKRGVWSFAESAENYMPFALGNQLAPLGYTTVAYHNHTYNYYSRQETHPNLGYYYQGIGNGLEMSGGRPRSDLEMMQVTLPQYIDAQPFHAYYMTISGHMYYNFERHQIAARHRHYVEDLPYSEPVKAFLATQIELDLAVEYLLMELDAAGIADNTLIAISSDHYPYALREEELAELEGAEIEQNFEVCRNAFLLYTPGMEPMTVDKISSSLDIIPTLSNLLGLDFDSRLLAGRDIFSTSEPLVIFRNGSFITDKGRFNSVTGEFMLELGVQVSDEYVEQISKEVAKRYYYSTKILETDYYSRILP